MLVAQTELLNEKARGLDLRAPEDVVRLLAEAQIEAARAALSAADAIAGAAELASRSLASGGKLAYAAAGSSGLMALADALELPGTYGIPRDRIKILLAGGTESLINLPGAPEDDADQARRDIADAQLGGSDCLIALSASGSTPYAIAALEAAKERGTATIAIANNANAPIHALADVAILLETPPEMVAGSTRMGAATAQKIALNMISTLVAINLGHVHDGYMVNVHADNIKLRHRAARIVAAVSDCDEDAAHGFIERSGGSVKAAILMASGAANAAAASELLERSGQKLRPALSILEGERKLPITDT
ncbi:MAG: N-acetylmuramic acid 6-phosphate etherase [Phyllobacterium sp.]